MYELGDQWLIDATYRIVHSYLRLNGRFSTWGRQICTISPRFRTCWPQIWVIFSRVESWSHYLLNPGLNFLYDLGYPKFTIYWPKYLEKTIWIRLFFLMKLELKDIDCRSPVCRHTICPKNTGKVKCRHVQFSMDGKKNIRLTIGTVHQTSSPWDLLMPNFPLTSWGDDSGMDLLDSGKMILVLPV